MAKTSNSNGIEQLVKKQISSGEWKVYFEEVSSDGRTLNSFHLDNIDAFRNEKFPNRKWDKRINPFNCKNRIDTGLDVVSLFFF